jgi:hypothetical protein
MATIECRFFLLPSEAVGVLTDVLRHHEAAIYHQLHLGGLTVEPIPDWADLDRVVSLDRQPPVQVAVTHQSLSSGRAPGSYDAMVDGIIVVEMPFVDESTLLMGRIAARLDPRHENDATVARELARAFRKAAPLHGMTFRSLREPGPARTPVPVRTVGCSEVVRQLWSKGELSLRQWGVRYNEYLCPGS